MKKADIGVALYLLAAVIFFIVLAVLMVLEATHPTGGAAFLGLAA